MAGATGLEPAASCVTGRRSNLSEAARANVRENWRAKGEETADTRSIVCRQSETGQRSNQLNYESCLVGRNSSEASQFFTPITALAAFPREAVAHLKFARCQIAHQAQPPDSSASIVP